jgi:hypothetical protein
MGGVNFTRNRAWWHTAIWDEYGQRHQYIAIFPTFFALIPMYHYGSCINRQLEQTFAAKMYLLDYENKRNRLTHDMIMEHFEMHVEKMQDILDDVKNRGFELAFEEEIKNPESGKVIDDFIYPNEDMLAEVDEKTGLTAFVDEMKETLNVPFWIRQQMESHVHRRKLPGTNYKHLAQQYVNGIDAPKHYEVDPNENN